MVVDDANHSGEPVAAIRPELINRRAFLGGAAIGLGVLALAGCAPAGMSVAEAERVYGPRPNERFPIPAVKVSKINPKYFRRTVRYDSKEVAGTIIVDPRNHYVYRIEGDGYATRYGVSVGRAGFLWSGDAYIGRKAEWPIWTPPKEMIERQPEAAKYAGGMKPGLDNPLGARALYLYQNGVYTLYTLYSTSVPETIGTGVSSGCIGLITQDMLDLYDKTPVNTKVIVLKA
ncbi:hypothetical protein VW23_017795 [Devosia insulae DS-56]|uniref:L,D-TPase catalytic domain-containing protein n=1 Tax=Devosia insulae DS-56 TaxID=1116389 RepID=A0A1E5XRC6_9HYPH|nr:L,D-transpeptidase [Devosia insulae]OEO31139.1 hypothetical protein VW23_017795 [Devosia insulae DS-56]